MFPKSLSGGKLSLSVVNDDIMNNYNDGVALTLQLSVSRRGSIKSYDIYLKHHIRVASSV